MGAKTAQILLSQDRRRGVAAEVSCGGRKALAGVAEFTAEEGEVGVPPKVARALALTADAAQKVEVPAPLLRRTGLSEPRRSVYGVAWEGFFLPPTLSVQSQLARKDLGQRGCP